MSSDINQLIHCLRQSYEQHASQDNARFMSAYMRDQFVFYGIKMPERRRLQVQCLRAFKPVYPDLVSIIHTCYNESQREWHYFTCDLVDKHYSLLSTEFIQTTEFMITQHSWWDTVDTIATKIVGYLVQHFPDLINIMDQWIVSDNVWLRRSAILHQLKYKQQTNVTKLLAYCEQCADSNEFFIQKAIGWALREYSKTNALAVEQFVATHHLSKLSQREALKWLHTHSN